MDTGSERNLETEPKTIEDQDYSRHVLIAQYLINDTRLCGLYQDKKFLEMLDSFAKATLELKAAAIIIGALALRNANIKN